MSYTSFKNKWLGKRVDYDGVYAYQCVDLIKQYLHEEFGLRPGAWGDAIDYWTRTNANVLSKFTKVSGSSAKQGDIVVLNGLSGNPYGHIGIATGSSNGSSVEILEQNGSTGNGSGTGGDAIRTRYVSRSRVAGLLRPKTSNNKSNQGGDEVKIGTDNNWRWRMNRLHRQLVGNWDMGEDTWKAIQGRDTWGVIEWWSDHPNSEQLLRDQEMGEIARRDNWQGQIYDLQNHIKSKDAEIKQLKADVAAGGSNEDSVKLNALGAALRWLIQRLGLK